MWLFCFVLSRWSNNFFGAPPSSKSAGAVRCCCWFRGQASESGQERQGVGSREPDVERQVWREEATCTYLSVSF